VKFNLNGDWSYFQLQQEVIFFEGIGDNKKACWIISAGFYSL